MSKIPKNLKFAKSHEWLDLLDDGTVRVGISDPAQDLLGDMVYVELPEIGCQLTAGDECAVVESVKAASDIYAPVSGEVVEVNESVVESPDLINSDPYGDGWLMRLKLSDTADLTALLDAGDYTEVAEAGEN